MNKKTRPIPHGLGKGFKEEPVKGTPVLPEQDVAVSGEDMLRMQYSSLLNVLDLAYERAARGKGADRHGDSRHFNDQDMIRELTDFGISPGLVQIRKKAKEVLRLGSTDAKIKELLDVIVYAASSVIILQNEEWE